MKGAKLDIFGQTLFLIRVLPSPKYPLIQKVITAILEIMIITKVLLMIIMTKIMTEIMFYSLKLF